MTREPHMLHIKIHTHTHTHPFNGPFSGATWVSRYLKGKTNLDFSEARDSEWQWHQLGHMQVCISLQTYNHASTRPLSFLQARCPSCRPTTASKHIKKASKNWLNSFRPLGMTHQQHTHTHSLTVLCLALYPGRPAAKETFTHSHRSWSSDILYHLSPSTMIRSFLLVLQFMCLTVLFHNLSPGPLWSSSWSAILYFILHTFLHSFIILCLQYMPIRLQPVLLWHQCHVIYS